MMTTTMDDPILILLPGLKLKATEGAVDDSVKASVQSDDSILICLKHFNEDFRLFAPGQKPSLIVTYLGGISPASLSIDEEDDFIVAGDDMDEKKVGEEDEEYDNPAESVPKGKHKYQSIQFYVFWESLK